MFTEHYCVLFTFCFTMFILCNADIRSNKIQTNGRFNYGSGCFVNGKLPADENIEDHLFESLTDPKCYKNWIRPKLGKGIKPKKS